MQADKGGLACLGHASGLRCVEVQGGIAWIASTHRLENQTSHHEHLGAGRGERLACWCLSWTIDLEHFRLSTVLRVRIFVTARSDQEWAQVMMFAQETFYWFCVWDVWYWKIIRTSACDTYKFGSRTPCVRPLYLSWNKSRVTSPWHDCISAWPCNGVHAYRRAWNAGSSLQCEGRRAETLNRCMSQRSLNPHMNVKMEQSMEWSW